MTGLLGSIRFWGEAIVRGLGLWACDPTTSDSCRYQTSLADICLVCQVFGCNGFSAAFKIEITQSDAETQLVAIKRNTADRRHNGWRIPTQPQKPFTIRITPRQSQSIDPEYTLTTLKVILKLIEKFGAIGAKASQGCGIISTDIRLNDDTITNWNNRTQKKSQPNKSNDQLPSIAHLTSLRSQISALPEAFLKTQINGNPNWQVASQAFRIWLRNQFRTGNNAQAKRHEIMGTVGGKNASKRSDIWVSQGYLAASGIWEVRIVAWNQNHAYKGDIQKSFESLKQLNTLNANWIDYPDQSEKFLKALSQ